MDSHIGAWKIFSDDVSKLELNMLPIEIDTNDYQNIISPHEAYVVYAIKSQEAPAFSLTTSALLALLHSVRQNIKENSYQACIAEGVHEGASFCTYAFVGKLAKPKLALAALSYAYKI